MASLASTSAPVAVITTIGCPYCKKAKDALKKEGIEYEDIELSSDLELLGKIKKATGQTTVPQVFVGGKLIGGASELLEQISSGNFSETLKAAEGKRALPDTLQAAVDKSALQKKEETGKMQLSKEGPIKSYAQLRKLAREMGDPAAGVPRKSCKTRGKIFSLKDGASWLVQKLGVSEAEASKALGQLQEGRFLTVPDEPDLELGSASVLAATVLSLVSDALPPSSLKSPLNTQFVWWGSARSASEVAEGLRRIILGLYDKYLSDDGKAVDYKALATDPDFAEYTRAAGELQKVQLEGLSREERMAFFINIYNALIVHGLVQFGTAENWIKRLAFFGNVKYLIGGYEFSANDIEHGVLRANAANPAALASLLGKPQWAPRTFKEKDPRAALSVSPVDPRIHFALVCGAKSCPPIKVYTPAILEEGLASSAAAFCEGEVSVDTTTSTVTLSKIFQWYGSDFGSKEQMLQSICKFLPAGKRKADLEQLLSKGDISKVQLQYKPYDWTMNSKE